ncbi:ribosomal RNA small subunit methyltransferase A [bacterium]|nr:ribosomal RNA small subunit methyltransferase A [candidate division CSSED10-310 bacterium]
MTCKSIREVVPDPISTLSEDLLACDIQPNRLKGQNYLISSRIRNRIVDLAELTSNDAVLEIGAGTGILTWALAREAGEVIAVEQERRAAERLGEKFSSWSNLRIVCGDGLELLRRPNREELKRVDKIVSNLPYSISSPVLMSLAEQADKFFRCVLLLQKEVVERVIALPGTPNRCALSVLVQMNYSTRLASSVKATHFRPVPSVNSAVLVMNRRSGELAKQMDLIKQIAFILFRHRRKTVFNNLKMEFGADMASSILTETGIPKESRAQDLDELSFIVLGNLISRNRKANAL